MATTHDQAQLPAAALADAATNMDTLAQHGLYRIVAIARGTTEAIRASQDGEGHQPLAHAASIALETIWGLAEVLANDINATAEAVGCNARVTPMP